MSQDGVREELNRLADEEPMELVDASQTRSALEGLYGSPIPEADLARARASLAEHRRAS